MSKLRVKIIAVCAIIIIIFSQDLQRVISYSYTLSSSDVRPTVIKPIKVVYMHSLDR